MSTEAQTYLFPKEGMHEYKGKLYLPFMPPSILEQVQQFNIRSGDILFGTFPRSGTPFLSEILWLVHNEADLQKARSIGHGVRVRFMEHLLPSMNPLDYLETLPSPRLLKTHLPATFFEKQLTKHDFKTVVMIRNPKDQLVSFFKFYTANPGYVKYDGDWSSFFEIFKAKQLFGGDWFEHAQSWYGLRHRDDVMIVKYEDIRENPSHYVQQIAQHCDKKLPHSQVDVIADYIMNEVPEESGVGEWKNFFTVAQNEYFDALYREKLGNTGLEFLHMH